MDNVSGPYPQTVFNDKGALMGTRADFYVGRGTQAEWLGSIGMDGYPDGVSGYVLAAKTEDNYRKAVAQFLKERSDGTTPDMGWPWPWDDSNTTDYAYAFDDGTVYACPFGHGWFVARDEQPEDLPDDKTAVFPDMKDKKKVALGRRSGLLIIG